MIAPLHDFTAVPLAPISGIAPKELVGNAKFPQLLGGVQAAAAKPISDSTPQEELAIRSGARRAGTFIGHDNQLKNSGNSLPQTGTTLPSGPQGDTWHDDPAANSHELRSNAIGHDLLNSVAPSALPAEFGVNFESDNAVLIEIRTDAAAMQVPQAANSTPAISARTPRTPQVSAALNDEEGTSPSQVAAIRRGRSRESITNPMVIKDQADDQLLPSIRTDKALTQGPDVNRNEAQSAAKVTTQSEAQVPAHPAATPRLGKETAGTAARAEAVFRPGQDEVNAQPLSIRGHDPKPATQLNFATVQDQRIGNVHTILATPKQARTSPTQNEPLTREAIVPVQSPLFAIREPQPDENRQLAPKPTNLPNSGGAGLAPSLSSGETSATQPANAQPPAAAPAVYQSSAPIPTAETNIAFRFSAQLESTIDQLAETRSVAQSNRSELTVRHQEFGAITMRLDAAGSDLRATLSARDPGFVPAIQTALAERGVAASGDTASTAHKGSDQQGSQANAQTSSPSSAFSGSQGQGWNSGGFYGSSTRGGEGTSQPYAGQTQSQDDESGLDHSGAMGRGDEPGGDGEHFA